MNLRDQLFEYRLSNVSWPEICMFPDDCGKPDCGCANRLYPTDSDAPKACEICASARHYEPAVKRHYLSGEYIVEADLCLRCSRNARQGHRRKALIGFARRRNGL